MERPTISLNYYDNNPDKKDSKGYVIYKTTPNPLANDIKRLYQNNLRIVSDRLLLQETQSPTDISFNIFQNSHIQNLSTKKAIKILEERARTEYKKIMSKTPVFKDNTTK